MSHTDQENMSSQINDQDPNRPYSDRDGDRSPLRNPELDSRAHLWIALAVVIPVVCALVLCIITACIFRYRKKRVQQNATTAIDQHNAAISTIFPNPIIMEELPPSYDIISETKKDHLPQFHSSPIKTETTYTPPPSYNSDINNPPK